MLIMGKVTLRYASKNVSVHTVTFHISINSPYHVTLIKNNTYIYVRVGIYINMST